MKLMKFNPGFLSNEELVSSFCVRLPEFDSILEMLSEAEEASSRHRLVIGPRGSGKTTLLLRVATEIRSNPKFSEVFFPVVFAEESYFVANSGEFWLEAVARLAEQAPNGADEDDLGLTLEELRTIRDQRMLERQCLATLLEFAEHQGKRLVLIVENLDMMFAELADQEAGWNIRKVLQTEPRILLLAGANSRFEEIDSPDRAFYDLFVTTELRPLRQEECSLLWTTVSGQSRPPEAMHGLEILTGGNPRLLSMVARFGAEMSFRDLMEDLLALVDELTDYFKSHIESLPPQERRVYLGLAHLWEPATARDIAKQARLDTSTCSAQLLRLVRRGVVEVVGGGERRKLYAITQRLFNIYYLLRRSRTPSPLVRALVRFMEAYFSTSELRSVVFRIFDEASDGASEESSIHWDAFAQLISLPALQSFKAQVLSDVPAEQQYLAEEWARTDTTVVKKLKDIWHHLENENESDALLELTRHLRSDASRLIHDYRFVEALDLCDKLLRLAAGHEDFRIRVLSTFTTFIRATALREQGKHVEELAAYDELLSLSSQLRGFSREGTEGGLRQLDAATLFFKGTALRNTGQLEKAEEVFGEIMLLSSNLDSEEFNSMVGSAISSRRDILLEMNRYERAIAACEDSVKRFNNTNSPSLNEAVAKSLVIKSALLLNMGNYRDGAAAADEAIRFLGDDADSTRQQAHLAKALLLKSSVLDRLDNHEEAVRIRREILHRFESSEEPALISVVRWTLTLLATNSRIHGDHEEAVRLTSRALAGGDSGSSIDLESSALLFRSLAHLGCGRSNSAAEDLKRALSLLPETNHLPPVATTALIEFVKTVGAEQAALLIEESPSCELLRPLLVALHMELGRNVKVPREVAEVAEDIRKNLRG